MRRRTRRLPACRSSRIVRRSSNSTVLTASTNRIAVSASLLIVIIARFDQLATSLITDDENACHTSPEARGSHLHPGSAVPIPASISATRRSTSTQARIDLQLFRSSIAVPTRSSARLLRSSGRSAPSPHRALLRTFATWPKSYRASTASRSFSAWKWPMSGSRRTSRLPFMMSGRLWTVRPMR